MILHRTV